MLRRLKNRLGARGGVGKGLLAVFVLFCVWYVYKEHQRSKLRIRKHIPRIIHQTWKVEKLPASLHTMVKSWEQNHPDWEYWFWTDENLWELVQKKFPEYMGLFTSYPTDIERVDVARYMILYEYGGVYADLDVESLKPLDELVDEYPCILGEEPWVHARLFDKLPRIVSNAVMACIKRHPFFLHVLENLPKNRETPTNAVVWRTGPHMITQEIDAYNKVTRDPNDVNSKVYVVDHEVFFPLPEPIKELRMRHMCTEKRELEPIQKGACRALKKIEYKFSVGVNSFTTHHWIGTHRKRLAPGADDTIVAILVPRVKRKFDFQE